MQAAAHGLPMVATKNGGPVDINRVIEELTLYISYLVSYLVPDVYNMTVFLCYNVRLSTMVCLWTLMIIRQLLMHY
jgi:hypothetical protein